MKQSIFPILLAMGVATAVFWEAPANAGDEVRQIRLIEDDAQISMTSKIYELKYVKATDIRPFVENAIKCYDLQSRVERVNYIAAKKNLLIVSTAPVLIPMVDDLIAKIDQPGEVDAFGSVIEGTGVTRVSYTPRYRAAQDIVRIINGALRTTVGVAYLDEGSNTIYWKDDVDSAKAILGWVKQLDRPLPQVNLHLNYYEVRESKLRDIGVDYLAWKNGPGLNVFGAGYDGGKVFSNEAVLQLVGDAEEFVDLARNFSTSWNYGGFFTAPQFDLSFIRLLQQSGNANLVSSANLTFLNTPLYGEGSDETRTYSAQLIPGYQNVKKNADDRTDVVTSSTPAVELFITNPVICFGAQPDEVEPSGMIPSNEAFYADNETGSVIFNYSLAVNSVVERNNRGDELGNAARIVGDLTLGFKKEKLLGSYVKENDVEQTIGIPFLSQIPILKYLFGTTTTLKEKSYIIVTAEASLVHPDLLPAQPLSEEVVAAANLGTVEKPAEEAAAPETIAAPEAAAEQPAAEPEAAPAEQPAAPVAAAPEATAAEQPAAPEATAAEQPAEPVAAAPEATAAEQPAAPEATAAEQPAEPAVAEQPAEPEAAAPEAAAEQPAEPVVAEQPAAEQPAAPEATAAEQPAEQPAAPAAAEADATANGSTNGSN